MTSFGSLLADGLVERLTDVTSVLSLAGQQLDVHGVAHSERVDADLAVAAAACVSLHSRMTALRDSVDALLPALAAAADVFGRAARPINNNNNNDDDDDVNEQSFEALVPRVSDLCEQIGATTQTTMTGRRASGRMLASVGEYVRCWQCTAQLQQQHSPVLFVEQSLSAAAQQLRAWQTRLIEQPPPELLWAPLPRDGTASSAEIDRRCTAARRALRTVAGKQHAQLLRWLDAFLQAAAADLGTPQQRQRPSDSGLPTGAQLSRWQLGNRQLGLAVDVLWCRVACALLLTDSDATDDDDDDDESPAVIVLEFMARLSRLKDLTVQALDARVMSRLDELRQAYAEVASLLAAPPFPLPLGCRPLFQQLAAAGQELSDRIFCCLTQPNAWHTDDTDPFAPLFRDFSVGRLDDLMSAMETSCDRLCRGTVDHQSADALAALADRSLALLQRLQAHIAASPAALTPDIEQRIVSLNVTHAKCRAAAQSQPRRRFFTLQLTSATTIDEYDAAVQQAEDALRVGADAQQLHALADTVAEALLALHDFVAEPSPKAIPLSLLDDRIIGLTLLSARVKTELNNCTLSSQTTKSTSLPQQQPTPLAPSSAGSALSEERGRTPSFLMSLSVSPPRRGLVPPDSPRTTGSSFSFSAATSLEQLDQQIDRLDDALQQLSSADAAEQLASRYTAALLVLQHALTDMDGGGYAVSQQQLIERVVSLNNSKAKCTALFTDLSPPRRQRRRPAPHHSTFSSSSQSSSISQSSISQSISQSSSISQSISQSSSISQSISQSSISQSSASFSLRFALSRSTSIESLDVDIGRLQAALEQAIEQHDFDSAQHISTVYSHALGVLQLALDGHDHQLSRSDVEDRIVVLTIARARCNAFLGQPRSVLHGLLKKPAPLSQSAPTLPHAVEASKPASALQKLFGRSAKQSAKSGRTAPAQSSPVSGERAIMLWSYAAQSSDELTATAGETVVIRSAEQSGWIEAEQASGKRGLLPVNFLRVSKQTY